MKPTNATLSASTGDLRWGPDLRSPLVLGLALLLGLQLLIALGYSLSESGMTAAAPRAPLLTLTPEQVTRVTIESSDGSGSVHLERRGKDQWVIGDLADFPAAGAKVEQLLTQVAGLKRPLPMATSEEARKRFKVADEGFLRRLTLEGKDGTIVTLILGDTPGFRRLFGRPAGDPAVYDLALAIADVSNRRDDWIDHGLLRIDQERIQGINGKDWTLNKTPDGWRLKDSDTPVDQDKAREVVTSLANLSYRGVLGTADDPAYNQGEPKLEISVQLSEGAPKSYRISQAKGSEDYVLKDADRPYYLKLSKFDIETLLDLDAAKLTAQPQPSKDESASEVQPSPDPAETTTAPLVDEPATP